MSRDRHPLYHRLPVHFAPRSIGKFLLALVLLDLPNQLAGQETARPFTLPDLGGNQQAIPTRVDAGGDFAIIEEAEGEETTIAIYSRDGSGTWSRADTLLTSDEVTAFALQETRAEAALGVGSQIQFHTEFFAPNWVYNGTSAGVTLPAGEVAREIVLAGDWMAVVTAETGFVINGGNRVRLYARGGGGWFEEAVLEVLFEDPVFGTSRATLADIDFDGTRLAAIVSGRDQVKVYGINQGGPGAWGEERTIVPSAGLSFGRSLALEGERLALQVFSTTGVEAGVDIHEANTGGTNQWGRVGRLLTLPSGFGLTELDSSNDRLLVTALPNLSPGDFEVSGEARMWIFRSGAGIGGWTADAEIPLGTYQAGGRGFFTLSQSRLSSAAISDDNIVIGFGADGGNTAALWAVNFYHRNFELGWAEEGRATGSGTATEIGTALAMSDGLLAVGNLQDDHAGAFSGSVLLWELQVTGRGDGQSLVPAGRLESPEPAPNQAFGNDVAIANVASGLIIGGGGAGRIELVTAVAAASDNNTRGAVYVFDPDASGGYVKVDPEEPLDQTDYFGWSIALAATGFDGDAYLAVGTPGDDEAAANAGAVYIFRRNQGGDAAWGLTKKITRPASVGGLLFGDSVAATGTISSALLVGKPEVGADPGRVALFPLQGSSISPLEVIDAPSGAAIDFADSIALTSSTLVVGATGDSPSAGRVYLYSRANLSLPPTVLLPENGQGPGFGKTVALDGDHLVIGSPSAAGGSGNVTCYRLLFPSGPAEPIGAQLLFSRDGTAGESLGEDVASWFLYSAAGAPDSDAIAPGAGRVRIDRAGPYEIWALNNGLTSDALFDPHGNPDGDCHSSLVEFALGGDPRNRASIGRFEMEYGTYSGGGTPEPAMQWSPPLVGYDRNWLDFRIEQSDGTSPWSTAPFYAAPAGSTRSFLLEGRSRQIYRLTPLYPWPYPASGRQGTL